MCIFTTPSVFWCCCLGGRKGIRPVKNWLVGCCLGWRADLHMAQLMPLPFTISCSSKSRLVLPFWYWLTQVVPDEGSLNRCFFHRMNESSLNICSLLASHGVDTCACHHLTLLCKEKLGPKSFILTDSSVMFFDSSNDFFSGWLCFHVIVKYMFGTSKAIEDSLHHLTELNRIVNWRVFHRYVLSYFVDDSHYLMNSMLLIFILHFTQLKHKQHMIYQV